MLRIKLIYFTLLFLTLSGCSFFNFNKEPEIVPEDFIVKQDTTFVLGEINQIQSTSEHIIRFRRGKSEISEKEQQKLFQWIQDNLPTMIAIRGTGGAEKYKDLGDQRGLSVVNLLQQSQVNVEILLLDYDAQLSGGRAIIQVVPPALAYTVRQQAPILIIKSS